MKLFDRWRRPTCHEVQRVLQQFLDGELGPSHADFVAAHLAQCDRCNIEAEIYDRVKRSLAAMRPAPDAATMSRLEAMAEQVIADPGPPANSGDVPG